LEQSRRSLGRQNNAIRRDFLPANVIVTSKWENLRLAHNLLTEKTSKKSPHPKEDAMRRNLTLILLIIFGLLVLITTLILLLAGKCRAS